MPTESGIANSYTLTTRFSFSVDFCSLALFSSQAACFSSQDWVMSLSFSEALPEDPAISYSDPAFSKYSSLSEYSLFSE